MSFLWARQAEFNQFIIERGVVGFFDKPITLKSGRSSNWYINFRTIAEDAKRLDMLSDFVVDFVQSLLSQKVLTAEPLCVYGVPEGATKLAVITQMKWAAGSPSYAEGSHPVPMGRAKPKEHGVAKDKYFVGEPRGSTLVLEDVTTTGGSLLTTLDQLHSAGVEVLAALGLANRMERRDDGRSVEQAILACPGAPKYFYLSSALELLPLAVERLKPSQQVVDAIREEFDQFGVKPVSL